MKVTMMIIMMVMMVLLVRNLYTVSPVSKI